MAAYFFDTSAVVKHYVPEIGTNVVDALLAAVGSSFWVSRLGVVELLSAFAKKVRAGEITEPDFQLLRRRLRGDVVTGMFGVVRVQGRHYVSAERLIRSHSTGGVCEHSTRSN